MQHRILPVCGMLILALIFSACASSGTTAVRTPIHLAIEADAPETWQTAASQLKNRVPEFDIAVSPRSNEIRYLDRISKSEDGQTGLCLSPKAEFDFAGSLTGFTPLYCGTLDETQPDLSLQNIVESYQSHRIQAQENESVVEFRQRILSESTPENPVCFSVFPALFSTGNKISEILMENYLIACARRIDGHLSPLPDGLLSSWILAGAAMITDKSSLISRAFKQIMRFRSQETSTYGMALEAYTEFIARKQIQAEISSMRTIEMSDANANYLISHETAQLLSLLVQTAESMDGVRLETIVRSLAPREGMPARLVEERQLHQLKICRWAVVIPDVTSGTASACLPWLRMSIHDEDTFGMALLLIEHGIYGAKTGEKAIAEDVLSWLQNAPLSEALKVQRHEFGQRFATNERLSDEDRKIVSTF